MKSPRRALEVLPGQEADRCIRRGYLHYFYSLPQPQCLSLSSYFSKKVNALKFISKRFAGGDRLRPKLPGSDNVNPPDSLAGAAHAPRSSPVADAAGGPPWGWAAETASGPVACGRGMRGQTGRLGLWPAFCFALTPRSCVRLRPPT